MRDTKPAVFHWFSLMIYSLTFGYAFYKFYTSNNFSILFVIGMGILGLIIYLTPDIAEMKVGPKGELDLKICEEKRKTKAEGILSEYIPVDIGDIDDFRPFDLDEEKRILLQFIFEIIRLWEAKPK